MAAKKVAKAGKTRGGPGKGAKPPLDGDALFEAAMRGTEPLKDRAAKTKKKDTAVPKNKNRASRAPGQPPMSAAAAPAPVLPSGGLDKRNAERLRRGQMKIEGRLDLHGHTQADAHRAAHAFIAASHRAGRRCVLIITGKGGARPDTEASFMPDRDSGVLRRNLPRWLAEPAMRPFVLSLEPARPQHGGDGAFYVLLRRKR